MPRIRLLPTAVASLFLLASPLPAGPAIEAEAVVVPSREVTLSLPMEATVREMRVKEGDAVKKGDVLAALYHGTEVVERDRAAKQLERAEFDLALSERLRKSETVSEEDARQKRLDYELAKIDLQRANAVLADKTLTAPFDGTVLRIHCEVGESVGRTEKIIELIAYDTLHVDAYLEAIHLGAVRPGQKARVVFPTLDNREAEAEFLLVDPVVEPGSGLFRVRLTLPNPGRKIPSGIPARLQVPAQP